MTRTLIHNALIINEEESFEGYILIEGTRIRAVGKGIPPSHLSEGATIEDLDGKWILPGLIDDQVHFREPGLTHKADIASESRAALAGGVTAFMDMPNCKPQTVNIDAWNWKMQRASETSAANFSFWIGATNQNIDQLRSADFSRIPGIKVFLGASTGNMLVDSEQALDEIFSLPQIVAIHSEDEQTISRNLALAKEKYGDEIPFSAHPLIRSHEACIISTRRAIERAKRLNTRLHILHISTAAEADMLSAKPLEEKRITAEVCAHHLWFSDEDYARLGAKIKWNPAIKTVADRDALREAVAQGKIDIVATDHAPHLPQEKSGSYPHAASGGPLVQHSLLMMLQLASEGLWSVEKVVRLMAHNPAQLFGIKERGFIREGYFADLTVVDPHRPHTVTPENILTKCGWSPLELHTFPMSVDSVYLNGQLAYRNSTEGSGSHRFFPASAMALSFDDSAYKE